MGKSLGVRRAAADMDGVTAFAKAAIEAMRSGEVMRACWKRLLTKEHLALLSFERMKSRGWLKWSGR